MKKEELFRTGVIKSKTVTIERQKEIIKGFAVVTKGDKEITNQNINYIIEVPEIDEFFSPMLVVIPLQLLAYYVARRFGYDIDQPRNLAKSVTVE